jgi:hypothetical protein
MSGFDYYDYVNGLSEAKLVLEREKLTKRLFKTNVTSPVYTQLCNMIDMADSAYEDILYTQRIKAEDKVYLRRHYLPYQSCYIIECKQD